MALSAAEASAQILAHIPRLAAERVSLNDALAFVLAEDVVAPIDLPSWRNSSMDGYAVRAADLADGTTSLRVVGEVPAGAKPSGDIGPGEAMKVMTGAPVPDSADTVIRVEDTDAGPDSPSAPASESSAGRSPDSSFPRKRESISPDGVAIRSTRDSGRNVRPAGEDYHRGDKLGTTGQLVTPALIGVLASAGSAQVSVFRKPRVAVVTSGDELVTIADFESVRAGDRIVSSNSYTLPALIRTLGAHPIEAGIAADTPESLRAAIESALECDLLLTSGGISVGERDYTRDVMRDLGAEMKFWRVRIRPGGPMGFGIVNGIPWIGLSGNPVSAMVTFELYVRPAILKMCGHTDLFPVPLTVTLDDPITVSGDLTHFLRVIIMPDGTTFHARLTGTQSSGALTSMARANALLIVPEGRQQYEPGEQLRAIVLDDRTIRSCAFPA